jgi:hypothetical protein
VKSLVLTDVTRIGIVVRDLDATMRRHKRPHIPTSASSIGAIVASHDHAARICFRGAWSSVDENDRTGVVEDILGRRGQGLHVELPAIDGLHQSDSVKR